MTLSGVEMDHMTHHDHYEAADTGLVIRQLAP
jgi:hypothetical protein